MRCAGCNYDLRGHSVDQCCPECGLSVRETLERRRARKSKAGFGAFLVLSLAAGCVCWFAVFVVAWSGQIGPVVTTAAALGVVPAALSGMIGRHFLGKEFPRIVATTYAWPMAGWGLGALLEIPSEGWGMAIWAAIGALMFGAALLGTYIFDWMHRYFTSP